MEPGTLGEARNGFDDPYTPMNEGPNKTNQHSTDLGTTGLQRSHNPRPCPRVRFLSALWTDKEFEPKLVQLRECQKASMHSIGSQDKTLRIWTVETRASLVQWKVAVFWNEGKLGTGGHGGTESIGGVYESLLHSEIELEVGSALVRTGPSRQPLSVAG